MFFLKKIVVVLTSLLLFSLLSGCGKDPVQEDLISYINTQVKPLGAEESKIQKEYASVAGINYSDDPTLYSMVSDHVIPEYRAYADKVTALKFQTKEVRQIHEIYIQAVDTQMSAFVTLSDALDKQDASLINDANAKIAKSSKLVRDFHEQLSDLAKSHNVVFDNNN